MKNKKIENRRNIINKIAFEASTSIPSVDLKSLQPIPSALVEETPIKTQMPNVLVPESEAIKTMPATLTPEPIITQPTILPTTPAIEAPRQVAQKDQAPELKPVAEMPEPEEINLAEIFGIAVDYLLADPNFLSMINQTIDEELDIEIRKAETEADATFSQLDSLSKSLKIS
jgi:hypothetical protein